MEAMGYKSEYPTDTQGHDTCNNCSLSLYLREINRTPLLTRREERELGKRIRNGDNGALDWLVRANLRFVVSIAKHYVNRGLPLEDLIGEGNLGLLNAARRFDEQRGYKFISYAVWWIRQAILKALAEHSGIVRLPLSHLSMLRRIRRLSGQVDQELGRTSSTAEIAKRIRMPEKKVHDAMNTTPANLSLNDPCSGDANDTLLDYLVDKRGRTPEDEAIKHALRDDMARVIYRLSGMEKLALQLYFGLSGEEPMTLAEVGKKLDLTGERVRQIKNRAIRRLRKTWPRGDIHLEVPRHY